MKRLEEVASASDFATSFGRDVHGSRFLAVYVDLDRRIVQRLDDLEIPEAGKLAHLVHELGGVGAGLGEIRPVDGDLHGRGRAETHHLVDDVGRFERKMHARQGLREPAAEFLFELLDVDAASPLQGHPHHGLFRPPHPLKHAVDRVAGADRAEIAQARLHVVRARGVADDRQGLQGNLLGLVDVGSIRGADAKAELAGVDGREDLRAQPRAQPPDDRRRQRQDRRPR